MAGDFKTTISALWSELQLQAPRFGPQNEIVMTVDGVDLTFRDSPDERHLLVTAAAGRLAIDPPNRARQVQTLMQASLGILAATSTCLNIRKELDGVNLTVLVEAVYSYDVGRVGDLIQLIQEVLRVYEIPRGELVESFQPRRPVPTVEDTSQSVIFRP